MYAGPVGLEGLVTYRYYLSSTSGHVVKDFAGETPAKKYTHKDLAK
jgi:hypothetical protein